MSAIPLGTITLGLVLSVESCTGSLSLAGTITALFTFGNAVGLTVQGALIDHLGDRVVVLTTGLIVGLLWGAWHFPLFSGGDLSGALPLAVFLSVQLLSFLAAYRVLMVWVYDRAGSLLVAMLMHASLTASTLILQPLDVTGMRVVTYDLILTAALWLLIAALAMANGRQLSGAPLRTRVARTVMSH